MTAPARLLALRLQGFKSFAERTVVEFGPGISAIVGPNGSGKSNLADALRWTLGEQGRALRSRKSEDVIFAGSDRRAALGMADVTLVLDNADALLPVDYSVIELGRRLFRSGENDYLLNRQRVRLRDLVDLLDSAHLADNAFLFIGQGMVDQALALRPEERRPLFEEVAGVRRHERRRRHAEEQLVEAEANLARVDDILTELRPQARRLAVQAEQQVTRASAGDALATALVVAAHGRWHEAAGRLRTASERLARERAEAEGAMTTLGQAEAAAAAISAALGARADLEHQRRAAHEHSREALSVLQLREARLSTELGAIERDRARIEAEHLAAQADLEARKRELASPPPQRDQDLVADAAEAERRLAEALEQLGALRTELQAGGAELAALRRAEAARVVESETARRRLADADRRANEERDRAAAARAELTRLEARLADARKALADASDRERTAGAASRVARAAAEESEGRSRAASERALAAGAAVAALGGRIEAARARWADAEARGIARAARKAGGRRVDESLEVDPAYRSAVEAALGEVALAYVVERDAVARLAGERGLVIPSSEPASSRHATGSSPSVGGSAPASGRFSGDPRERAFRARLEALGGGILSESIRHDPLGAARRLLERAAWVRDLAAVVQLQPDLPAGWLVVARDGSAVGTPVAIALGRVDHRLERRVELARLEAELERSSDEAAESERFAIGAAEAADAARARLEEERTAEARAGTDRRAAEETERVAAREAESATREAAWNAAQAERAAAEADRLRAVVADMEAQAGGRATPASKGSAEQSEPPAGESAIAAWEGRLVELRTRRDRLAAQLAEADRRRRDVEAVLARATAGLAYAEERIARADADARSLAAHEAQLQTERDRLVASIAAATAREEHARAVLDELRAADAADRERLFAAEADASAAREGLRAADERVRGADVALLEARLGLDAIREQVLVELAGIGEVGLRALRSAGGMVGAGGSSGSVRSAQDGPGAGNWPEADAETAELEALLALVLPAWEAAPPAIDPPGPARLGALRRRFHELGAANPFAIEEFAELKTRLESLEAQRADLESAIARTRAVIDELSDLIADQFRSTFRALEAAFDGRFRQLFGGGFARLDLTDPADLSATGVEIVARPPGKKPQALAMLSGGERALTAVALLFAMLEVRPVPFCVLDEVDAALDEANIGRFSAALQSLAGQTQFIVITHNRGTIEIADALYGVTVGDDSVSRVISLRLDEATALAGSASGDGAGRVGLVSS